MVKCNNCGFDVIGSDFCPNCGTKVVQEVLTSSCPNCGFDVGDSAFCPKCGTKIGAEKQDSPSINNNQSNEQGLLDDVIDIDDKLSSKKGGLFSKSRSMEKI